MTDTTERGAMASYSYTMTSIQPSTSFPDSGMPRLRLLSLPVMLQLILRPEGEVVVIHGDGGLGKTWAARTAVKTARNSNRFDTYIWVPLSESSSLRRCVEKIVTCLSFDIGEEILSSRISVMIKEHLARRKFLLVLDNAYFVEENILQHMGIPDPREQNFGSKVIVTTRTGRARSVVKPSIIITPQTLSYQASYDLLHEKIGKDIDRGLIEYCFGMPLSLILLAGALCDVPTQEEFLELIREAVLAQGPKISVFVTMNRLVNFGYRRLPTDTARRCFLYCLRFPADEAISVKDLIISWKLYGMIQEARDYQEANSIGMEIIHVLLKHGLMHFEGDDHIRMHDVIRETISELGRASGHVEQLPESGRCFDNNVQSGTQFLRGIRHLRTISEDFFCRVGMLKELDLSFTQITILPQSISRLLYLKMLLLVGCGHLEKIQHIGSLEMLEVLNASDCVSLKKVECGTFDRMRLLKILDLSKTSIECLPSLAVCTELNQLLLQDCPCLKSEEITETNDKSCDTGGTRFIKFPYGVSKKGALRNLQLGAIKDLVDLMDMLWLPCGLSFKLSNLFGWRISQDVNQTSKTYIHASHANLFQSLDKESPLWLNCLRKFHIVISPKFEFGQTMDHDFRVVRTRFSSADAHSSDFDRFLEINCVSITNDIKGILSLAELISLKSVSETDQVCNLNTGKLTAARELWIEECHQLENLLLVQEVHVLSRMDKLHNIWISNMENLASFCQGIEVLTSFSCLMHLHLDCCPKLNFLFPSSLQLPNLRRLDIRFCDSLERVFDEPIDAEHVLPGLQSLQLWELPELSCICGGVLPSLKDLKARGCAKLKKIPVGVTEKSPFFTKIIGEARWWDDLVWDDEGIKRWVLFRTWGPLLPHFATEG